MFQLLQASAPPSNLAFLIAAFVVTGLALVGYVFFVFRRRQEARSEIDRLLVASGEQENAGQDSA